MDSPQLPEEDVPPMDWRVVGLRKTPQRETILHLVRSNHDHPTAEWIHKEARRSIPDISLATVYRTLRLLKENGLIHEFSGGASPSRFDGTLHHHEHVRCVRCGAVQDVDLPEVGDIREKVAERTGFLVARYPLLFHGLCERCARENGNGSTDGSGRRVRAAPKRAAEDDPDRHLNEDYW